MLGAGTWTTTVSLVIPSRVRVHGIIGSAVAPGLTNGTTISATSGFPGSTAVIVQGNINPSNFVSLDHLSINCSNVTGAIGLQNLVAQEESSADHIHIANCPGIGLDVESANAQNAGPYTNLYLTNANCSNCGTVSVPIKFNGLTMSRGINSATINYDAATQPTSCMVLDGALDSTFENIHMEGCTTYGILIGNNAATTGVRLINIDFGNGSQTMANGTAVSNNFSGGTHDNLFIGLSAYSTTSPTTIILDVINSITLTSSREGNLVSFYTHGHGNTPQAVITSSRNVISRLGGLMPGGGLFVSSLPAAASSPGVLIYVTDSTTISAEGQTCVGSSNNKALAFSNGGVWKCF